MFVPNPRGSENHRGDSDESAWDEIAGYEEIKKVGVFPRFYIGYSRFGSSVDSVSRKIPRNSAANATQLLESVSAGVTF